MSPKCINQLPKLLVNTLENVFDENELKRWNLQSQGNVVYINLCFAPVGYKDNQTALPSIFKHKTPSQRKRDMDRYQNWQCKRNLEFDEQLQDQEDIHKKENIVDMSSMDNSDLLQGEAESQTTDKAQAYLDDQNNQDIQSTQSHENIHCESVLQNDENFVASCSNVDLKSSPNESNYCGDNLEKIIFDDEQSFLVAKTKYGTYLTYKYRNKSHSQSEVNSEIYQSVLGNTYQMMNRRYFSHMFSTYNDVRNDPKFHEGICYIRESFKSGCIK